MSETDKGNVFVAGAVVSAVATIHVLTGTNYTWLPGTASGDKWEVEEYPAAVLEVPNSDDLLIQ